MRIDLSGKPCSSPAGRGASGRPSRGPSPPRGPHRRPLCTQRPGRAEPGRGDRRRGGGVRRGPGGPPGLPQAVERRGRALRPIDVLMNNAGVALPSPLEAVDDRWIADWNRTQAVNLLAAGVLCRSAIAHFAANRRADRQHRLARRPPRRHARLFRLCGVQGRAARPDQVDRPLLRQAGNHRLRGLPRLHPHRDGPGLHRPVRRGLRDDGHRAPRMTEPEDIAPTVVFLASGLADHATGSTIDVNAASYVR